MLTGLKSNSEIRIHPYARKAFGKVVVTLRGTFCESPLKKIVSAVETEIEVHPLTQIEKSPEDNVKTKATLGKGEGVTIHMRKG